MTQGLKIRVALKEVFHFYPVMDSVVDQVVCLIRERKVWNCRWTLEPLLFGNIWNFFLKVLLGYTYIQRETSE